MESINETTGSVIYSISDNDVVTETIIDLTNLSVDN
jgi:hypothetical protein